MSLRHPLAVLPFVLTLVLLSGCAAEAPRDEAPAQPSEAPAGHGDVEGAAEVPEPPLTLVSIDAEGTVGALDLLDGTATRLGAVSAPRSAATDGRYVFTGTADGVTVIDSGVWTWDHGDHFHYYRAEPSVVGEVAGAGPVSVSAGLLSTAGSTGLYFAGSHEAVLLDNAALSRGRIDEVLRVDTDGADGVIAPLGDGALVGDLSGRLTFYGADGAATDATVACDEPAGSITTRVGLVVGCADGAVLATIEDTAPVFERIPYPTEAGERARAFDARKGRPTVAAVAGQEGFWLLDTRERSWRMVPTSTALTRVVAVDDEDGHVVALDAEGRVRVFSGDSGAEVAATDPLVGDAGGGSVAVFVDGQRAYLNDPDSGVVHEIAYADGARIARTLEAPTSPDFFAEVGR